MYPRSTCDSKNLGPGNLGFRKGSGGHDAQYKLSDATLIVSSKSWTTIGADKLDFFGIRSRSFRRSITCACFKRSAVQLTDMDSSLQELKELASWGWTYAVIWKIGPDHRTPIWHQSYLNEEAGAEVGPAERFESIYRQCQFTPDRPGYAYLAWQRQSPFWWTRLMEPVLTDKSKELFLTQAGIQTLVCIPGRTLADGTGYCVELACTALVSETEVLRNSIQEFLNTSIDPYISTTASTPLLQEVPALDMDSGGPADYARAALAHQTSVILTDITSQASMGEDEGLIGNIVRSEEPYLPWTMSSSHYVNAGPGTFQTLHDVSFNYDGPPLLEPLCDLDVATIQAQPSVTTEWTTSRSTKGKEILVEESDLVLANGNQSLVNLVPTSQQEALERLRSGPPSASSLVPSAQGSQIALSSGYGSSPSLRPIAQMPPGHSPRSLFRPHGHLQFPRLPGVAKKRQSLIHKWATNLVPRIVRMREEFLSQSSSGTDVFDPKSLNSAQSAVAHKIAERNRRFKFNHKLQTLISIVPMINKKKDKVSVLSSTIDYIRQLNLRIASLKKMEEAAPSTPRMEEGAAAAVAMDREEEQLTTFNDAHGACPSSAAGGSVVVVEGSPGEDKWVIKVKANDRTRSLIQLLNVLLELELGVVTVDYGTSMNGPFHATVCVKNSRNLSMSSSELQAMLCRVLETGASSITGSEPLTS